MRALLGARGEKRTSLSKFVEVAVRWRVFHRTVQNIKACNADTDPDELQRIIDEAVADARTQCRRQRARKPATSGTRRIRRGDK